MNRETVAYLLSGERREDILAGDKHIPLFKKYTKTKNKNNKAGWVFRVEVVTSDVAKPTKRMITELEEALKKIPHTKQVKISELGEKISLFEKKEIQKPSEEA